MNYIYTAHEPKKRTYLSTFLYQRIIIGGQAAQQGIFIRNSLYEPFNETATDSLRASTFNEIIIKLDSLIFKS